MKASQEKTPSGDKFADMLADADSAQDARPAPKARERQSDKTNKNENAAEKPAASEDSKTETAKTDKAEATRGETKADGKDGDKKKDVAANDNNIVDATADLPQPVQQQQSLLQLALDGSRAQNTVTGDDNAAATDAAVVAPANGAAQGGDASATDAAADVGETAPEFEKALHQAKAEAQAQAMPAMDTARADTKAADLNNIVLTQPAANGHAAQGAEKIMTAAPTMPQEAPLPTPNVNQFAVDIAAKSQSGAKQFDIRLDPPELGRVEVRLSIDASGKAEAHLSADQPQTLDLLQKDAATLTRALRDAGLNLPQDGLNFSLKNQQQHADGGQRQAHDSRPSFTARNSEESRQSEVHAYVRRALGVVDIKV